MNFNRSPRRTPPSPEILRRLANFGQYLGSSWTTSPVKYGSQSLTAYANQPLAKIKEAPG